MQLGNTPGGMPVVPTDEGSGAGYVRKLFAGNAKLAVARCSGGQYHNVVHPAKFIERDVAAHFDISKKPHAIPPERAVQNASHSLGALMIGRDSIANQAKRYRQLLQHIDAGIGQQLEQMLSEIAAGRPGADDAKPLFAIRHSPETRRSLFALRHSISVLCG